MRHFFSELEACAVNRTLLVGSKTLSVRTMGLVHDTLSLDHSNVEKFHFSGKHNSKPFPNGPLRLNLQPCKK